MPDIVGSMASKAGLPFSYAMHAPGGAYVALVDQGNFAHAYNPYVFGLLRSQNWDYVIVQDNQGYYVWDYGDFPAKAQVFWGHQKLRDSMRAANQCSHMMLFAGWVFKNGYPDLGFSNGSQMNQRVYENYTFLNDSLHEMISPIGIAWNRAITQLPNLDLWHPDESHPSYAGSYLTAATIFSSIFKINTEFVTFSGNLDSLTAAKLRRIAYQTVMDSLLPTKANILTPQLNHSGNTLSVSSSYTNFIWYKNRQVIAGATTNSITISGFGTYQVAVTDSKGCKFRSAEKFVAPTPVFDLSRLSAEIYPNPSHGLFYISTQYPLADNATVTICDLTGKVVYSKVHRTNYSSKLTIDAEGIASGMYVIQISSERNIYRTKLSIF